MERNLSVVMEMHNDAEQKNMNIYLTILRKEMKQIIISNHIQSEEVEIF